MTPIQGAAEPPAWKCVQENTTHDRPWDTPGLVKVVEAMERPVGCPAPPAEYALHPGQQYTPKKKLFSQDRVEDGVHDKQGKEPPRAHQPVQDFLRFKNRAEAISRRARQRRERARPTGHRRKISGQVPTR